MDDDSDEEPGTPADEDTARHGYEDTDAHARGGTDTSDHEGTEAHPDRDTEPHGPDGTEAPAPRLLLRHETRSPRSRAARRRTTRSPSPQAARLSDLRDPRPPDPREPRPPDPRKARWERRAEVPLAIAALLFLAAYAVRVLAPDLPGPLLDLCLAVTLATWALFAVDYAVRWRLDGQRLRFVRTHLLDTAVLALPLLRPLRIVKVYEAVQRRHGRPRLALHARVMVYAGLATVLLGFAGALAVYQQERGAPDASMRTFGDALWWTCATFATVGYGDIAPVTPLGRVIAVGMMALGLALLGSVTGTFASWLLQVFAREDDERPPGS